MVITSPGIGNIVNTGVAVPAVLIIINRLAPDQTTKTPTHQSNAITRDDENPPELSSNMEYHFGLLLSLIIFTL